MGNFRQKYIGDKKFYKHALAIALPMIIQNLITNFVSMLDNIMVGQVGTAEMTGVSIVNQLIFVFNITIFGGVSGASIFGTQFFGKKDHEGQKYTVRFRIILALLIIAVSSCIFWFLGRDLINLYISTDDSPELKAATLMYGERYLKIMIIGLIPFGMGQAYSSAVRECGETAVPMYGSIAAIGVNLVLDYGLIFGKFGMPEMGVEGAAIATVAAKFVEAAVVIVWAHTHKEKNRYISGLYRGIHIPKKLAGGMIVKGCPLLINEFLWSLGMSVIAQSYSVKGLDVVAARNIASTLTNLFGVVYIQLGGAIGIIVGAYLGADKLKEAKDSANKLTFFAVAATIMLVIIMIPVAFLFPEIYKTEEAIKALAVYFIIIQAMAMPIQSYTNACYFILRSGGKTGITFMFDFIFTWFIMIPTAFVLTRYCSLNVHIIIAIVTYTEAIKAIVGYFLVKSGAWINNIVG